MVIRPAAHRTLLRALRIWAALSAASIAAFLIFAPSVAAQTASPPRPANVRTHTVEEGDTVTGLAARYKVSAEAILAANPQIEPDRLHLGQQLAIPSAGGGLFHTVKESETIRQIADNYGVQVAAIASANELENPDRVAAGATLYIPAAGSASPPAQASASSQAPRAASTGSGQSQAAPPSTGSGQAAAGQTASAAAQPPSDPRMYRVQTGDTLWSISQRFGIDIPTLLANNGLADANAIKAGSELRILPAKGVEYLVQPSDTLSSIARKHQVDLGVLLDYNHLDNPDKLQVGMKLIVPGGPARQAASASPSTTSAQGSGTGQAAAAKPPASASASVAQASVPTGSTGAAGRGPAIAATAMKLVGAPYAFGGTSPKGFDCSGFAQYVHKASGVTAGRSLWQQYNGGTRIAREKLQPGDLVFFANTYMPGLSHVGIYVGNNQFVHSNDEDSGVVVTRLDSEYWSGRFVGATRL